MKKWLHILLALVMVLSLAACGQEPVSDQPQQPPAAEAGESGDLSVQPVKLTVWGYKDDQENLKKLLEQFQALYPEQAFELTLEVKSGLAARAALLSGVATADVFAFSFEHLDALARGEALLELADEASAALEKHAGITLEEAMAQNVPASVDAATGEKGLMAFPAGGGENALLFYDSNVFAPADVESWESLLDAAQRAGTHVGAVVTDGAFTGSFFMGAGFSAYMVEDGSTIADFNGVGTTGQTGVQVLRSLLDITAHPGFMSVTARKEEETLAEGGLSAIVLEVGDADLAQEAFGENFAAAVLPSFTAGGKTLRQTSFARYELVGVNANTEQADWAVVLAQFLTNEAAQLARFESSDLVPVNLAAVASEAVAADPMASVAAQQDKYSVPDRTGTVYPEAALMLGKRIVEKDYSDDETALQNWLDGYVEEVGAPCT